MSPPSAKWSAPSPQLAAATADPAVLQAAMQLLQQLGAQPAQQQQAQVDQPQQLQQQHLPAATAATAALAPAAATRRSLSNRVPPRPPPPRQRPQQAQPQAADTPWTPGMPSSSSAACGTQPHQPTQPPPQQRGQKRQLSEWELADLRAEGKAARASGVRWQDRGPGPPDSPTDTWRGQAWRANSGRYANRGGSGRDNADWYLGYYRAKRRGVQTQWVEEHGHEYVGDEGGPFELREWRKRHPRE